ncbi:hypothetical protein COLO4_37262 [Corchorus olitorius]|uniref:Uncharacterized protein n=1 Tax=Corchorus olitorius TaxID=93759 RepID=A0A1R3G2M1_9ROSI|nr:hypothetical protein COLO4_37262 [Corchorus olitorius]
METRRRRRLQISASESTTDIRIKFTRLVSRQEELKVAFNQLKSQIKIGLAEAEDVFASLAVPLMKLVGLKTEEMADEGRFTTIIVDNDLSPNMLRNGLIAESPVISPTADGGEWNNQIQRKEESCATKFKIAREEFFEKQKSQLMQLVHLLRQVENRVNFHQDDILQGLTTQRGSLQKLFQKVVYCISSFHSQNNDTFLITLKLLQVLFEKTDEVLCSVEDGMQGLMQDLTGQMCNPMVEYVKNLKADLKTGTCANLLAVVDEMECSTRNGRIELEEVRKRLRVAEEGRIKALCQLKETEGKLRRMKEYQEFLAEIQQGHMEHLVSRKVHFSRPLTFDIVDVAIL